MFYKHVKDPFSPLRTKTIISKDRSHKTPLFTIVCDHLGLNVINHENGKECSFSNALIHTILQIGNTACLPHAINTCLQMVS